VWIPEFLPLFRWLKEEQGVKKLFEYRNAHDPGTSAVVGAAAFMSGSGSIVLFVISMLVEITGDVRFVIPIAIGAVVGRTVVHLARGHGLYHDLIHLASLPFLSHRSHNKENVAAPVLEVLDRAAGPQEASTLERARAVVRSVRLTETTQAMDALLLECDHNGFPVVDGNGRLVGLVRREVLKKVLNSTASFMVAQLGRGLSADSLQQTFIAASQVVSASVPGEPDVQPAPVAPVAASPASDLVQIGPVMDAAPYTIRSDLPLFRAHTFFHRLGLRHLAVVDEDYRPVGVLTRNSLRSAGSTHSGGGRLRMTATWVGSLAGAHLQGAYSIGGRNRPIPPGSPLMS